MQIKGQDITTLKPIGSIYANGCVIDEESDEEIEVWECRYCYKEFDTLKGCSFHENVHCKSKNINIKNDNYFYEYGKDILKDFGLSILNGVINEILDESLRDNVQ